MLRLEYPPAHYETVKKIGCCEFEKNALAHIEETGNSSLQIKYPGMKATLYITHKKVEGNLRQLLADAQKRTYGHIVKADAIIEQPYLHPTYSVYGMLYEVTGNAASQYQFYATDSIAHFLTGALYFYARPNYDSIYPAAKYLQKDLQILMETLKWNE